MATTRYKIPKYHHYWLFIIIYFFSWNFFLEYVNDYQHDEHDNDHDVDKGT